MGVSHFRGNRNTLGITHLISPDSSELDIAVDSFRFSKLWDPEAAGVHTQQQVFLSF